MVGGAVALTLTKGVAFLAGAAPFYMAVDKVGEGELAIVGSREPMVGESELGGRREGVEWVGKPWEGVVRQSPEVPQWWLRRAQEGLDG